MKVEIDVECIVKREKYEEEHQEESCKKKVQISVRRTYMQNITMSDNTVFLQQTRGFSSVGRAFALHAKGRRFDSGILHKGVT